MSSEAAFQGQILRRLRQVGDAHKHVDRFAGVPDLSFTLDAWSGPLTINHKGNTHLRRIAPLSGWIELKEGANEWLTPEQRIWVKRRGHAGAAVYMLRQEGRRVGLWWWTRALDKTAPNVVWQKYPTAIELAGALRELANQGGA